MIRGAGALWVMLSGRQGMLGGHHVPHFNPLSHGLVRTEDEQVTLILERLIILLGGLFGPWVGSVCENSLHNQVNRAIDTQRFGKVDDVRISAAVGTKTRVCVGRVAWSIE